MNNVTYPLGNTPAEFERLDIQATLLYDPYLDYLIKKSLSCLEIGCGVGSNLPLLLKANPNIHYTGIDISPEAINAANSKYHQHKNANFLLMDAASITLNAKYDLIFSKLVLWSVGSALPAILREVYRLLVPSGTFYALEPCNQLIQFYPSKPAMTAWMNKWDAAAIQQGLNPSIGISVGRELRLAGFSNVETIFFPRYALGSDLSGYSAIINNFKGFYMGPVVEKFGLGLVDVQDRMSALIELAAYDSESFVMDALFTTRGTV